jgi:hypothetical protein
MFEFIFHISTSRPHRNDLAMGHQMAMKALNLLEYTRHRYRYGRFAVEGVLGFQGKNGRARPVVSLMGALREQAGDGGVGSRRSAIPAVPELVLISV